MDGIALAIDSLFLLPKNNSVLAVYAEIFQVININDGHPSSSENAVENYRSL